MVVVKFVVPRDIARLLGPLDLLGKLPNDMLLDHLSAGRVDRVGDVGVELRAAIGLPNRLVRVNLFATLIAKVGTQVVLHPTAGAMRGELSARHGDKRAARSFNDFKIAGHKAVVESNRAKRFQTFPRLFHEFDANFGDFHDEVSLQAIAC